MKFKKDSIGYTIVFTFIVCMLFVVILAAANQLTLPMAEANKSFAAHLAVLKAFGLADASTSRTEVESLYSTKVRELDNVPGDIKGVTAAYTADIDGSAFVAVKVTGAGLWGSITAILATDPAASRIRGLEILDQQETPGLGGRIGEDWFQAQFKGEKVGPGGTVKVDQNGTGKGDPDKENGRVDAVTGASRTSDFVARIVADGLSATAKIGGSL
ncbi:MAG: FMN-binding protein [Rectinemataceae bacterium]